MRYLLDTNVLSNVTKPEPSAALINWMADQTDEDPFITSPTVAEIQKGILEKPVGKKRSALERWFVGEDGPSVFLPIVFSPLTRGRPLYGHN